MTQLTANASTLKHPRFAPGDSASNEAHWRRPIPFAMPAEQVYYWSRAWQNAEADALSDLEAGRYVDFHGEDASDVARWLQDEE